jgi:hypothetical protein
VSYLRDGLGNPVYSGPVNINGVAFTGGQALRASDFVLSNESLQHTMHGLSLKTNTRGTWDWEVAASVYDYGQDQKRQNTTALPGAATGGAGTLADGQGTGWNNLAVRGTWRPQGIKGAHIVDFGLQQDSYQLRYRTSAIAGNWLTDPAGALNSNVGGETRLQSICTHRTPGPLPRAGRRCWAGAPSTGRHRWLHPDPGGAPPVNTANASAMRRSSPQGRRVVAVVARHGAQGIGGPRGAHARPWASCMARPRPPTHSTSTTPTSGPKNPGPPSSAPSVTWATACCA